MSTFGPWRGRTEGVGREGTPTLFEEGFPGFSLVGVSLRLYHPNKKEECTHALCACIHSHTAGARSHGACNEYSYIEKCT